jgi:hypothetical protein
MTVERIGHTAPLSGPSKTRRASNIGASGFSALVSDGDDGGPGAVTGTGPTGGIESLLALQQVDSDGRAPNRRARQRGENLLSGLEKLRDNLLTGGIAPQTLHNLQQQLAQQREQIMDPRLHEIIDEIDLRAAVELAKWQRRL